MPNRPCTKLLCLLGISLRVFGGAYKIFQSSTKLRALADSTDGPNLHRRVLQPRSWPQHPSTKFFGVQFASWLRSRRATRSGGAETNDTVILSHDVLHRGEGSELVLRGNANADPSLRPRRAPLRMTGGMAKLRVRKGASPVRDDHARVGQKATTLSS